VREPSYSRVPACWVGIMSDKESMCLFLLVPDCTQVCHKKCRDMIPNTCGLPTSLIIAIKLQKYGSVMAQGESSWLSRQQLTCTLPLSTIILVRTGTNVKACMNTCYILGLNEYRMGQNQK
jgi:hypothetical protein